MDDATARDAERAMGARNAMAALFTREEYDGRLAALRRAMAQRRLDAALLSAPENIFYFTGLDHWGYFAPHLLIVAAEGGAPVLVTRAMERVTIEAQVGNARFVGHADGETAADAAVRLLRQRPRPAAVGIEAWSSGLPHGLAERIRSSCEGVRFVDISGLADGLRLVKSPAEQELMRAAARVSDAAAAAAIAAARAGASEREVSAVCSGTLIAAGGTYPGFGPFVRSAARLGEEHTTWTDRRLETGDALFLELSGCIARYHAPLGRLVHIGREAEGARAMAHLAREAFDAVLSTLREGARAGEVYAAWQGVVDRAGLGHYRRHHCGYAVGIGVPPSWTGGNGVTGLRAGSDLVVRTGMAFHVLSWLMATGRGDFFLSDTVLLGERGPEILTRTPSGITIR